MNFFFINKKNVYQKSREACRNFQWPWLHDVMCLTITTGSHLFHKWRAVSRCSRYRGWLWRYPPGSIGTLSEVKNSTAGRLCNPHFLSTKDYVVLGIITTLIHFNKCSLVIGSYLYPSCWWHFGTPRTSMFEATSWFCSCRILGNFLG